jgi:GNAT superfamily N-acetyltransferase
LVKRVHVEKVTSERLLRACRRQLIPDPETNVLPLCDLYLPLFRKCTVYGAVEHDAVLGVCSVFQGFKEPSVVLGTAEPEVKKTLIERALREISEGFISLCEADDVALFEAFARVLGSHREQQMTTASPKLYGTDVDVARVRRNELELLDKFYTEHWAQAWCRLQFSIGPYFCVKRHGGIVSAAGVHAVAPKVAQIGNVFTDEAWRGRGFGRACTQAVAFELASHGRILSLFVRIDNAPAIRMYEKMGFRKARDIILVRMSKTRKYDRF